MGTNVPSGFELMIRGSQALYFYHWLMTKNNNDLWIISLCYEPICGDTTDKHKIILSQQITMYWPKVKTFSVHTAYYLCKKKVLSFTVDLSFYGLIVFNSDCNAHSDWLQQWYHIKNVAYIRRLTSESFYSARRYVWILSNLM